jgi:hypothetical protein
VLLLLLASPLAFVGIAYYCRYKKNYMPVQSLSIGCMGTIVFVLLLFLLGGALMMK